MITLLEIVPFAAETSPHIDAARRHLERWVRDYGLIRKASAAQRFTRADFAWFAGRTYPTADENDLELVADCFAWLFLLDDQLDDGSVGRDLSRVRSLQYELASILLGPHRTTTSPATNDDTASVGLVKALVDLWARLDGRTTVEWRSRFVGHVAKSALAAEWEAENRIRGAVPDERTYIENRRHTGAIYVCMDLIEIVERINIPDAVYSSQLFSDALNAACDVVCWTNDICSLDKEHALGEHHNLVSIFEHTKGLNRDQAVARVMQAIAAAVGRFLELEPDLLRVFGSDRDAVSRYLAGMRSWMRGNVDWSLTTRRYRELGIPAEFDDSGYLDTGMLVPAARDTTQR
jgi:hypothetical protein